MKLFLLKLFTWWNGQTFGTQLWTWRFGELVGQDEQGNRYFRTKGRRSIQRLASSGAGWFIMALPRPPVCRRHGMAGCITRST